MERFLPRPELVVDQRRQRNATFSVRVSSTNTSRSKPASVAVPNSGSVYDTPGLAPAPQITVAHGHTDGAAHLRWGQVRPPRACPVDHGTG